MRTAFFVLVRLGPTRKMFALVGDGRPILEHLIDRMRVSREADLLALRTTTETVDDEPRRSRDAAGSSASAAIRKTCWTGS
jgi:hypothetical protein